MSTDTTNRTVATRWRLDPARSSAEFRVPNFWGLVKVKGPFDRLHGWLEIGDDGDGGSSSRSRPTASTPATTSATST